MSGIKSFFRRASNKILRLAINSLQTNPQSAAYRDALTPGDILLNIGAGSWNCEGWTNLDYPTEWYAEAQSKHPFIPYDIRNDTIPFKADSVKAVYCSHVIEHIENSHVQDSVP